MTPREMYQAALRRRKELEQAQKSYVPPKVDPAVQQQLYTEVMMANKKNTAPIHRPTSMVIDGGKLIDVFAEGGDHANNEKGKENPIGHAEDLREQEGQERILRFDKQGEDQGDGDQHGAQTESQAPTQGPRGEEVEEVWVSKVYHADTREALDELIPADARAVTRKRIWEGWALVKKT
jgi:hypothetical protein